MTKPSQGSGERKPTTTPEAMPPTSKRGAAAHSTHLRSEGSGSPLYPRSGEAAWLKKDFNGY